MWELDCEESWATKNWCFWSVVLEKTLESPLDCKEIQPVHPKGDHSLVFIRRTDAKAETLILWPPHAKSWLIGEDSDAGRDWGQEKETTEDEMAGWHHQLNGHEFEWTRSWWWTGRPGRLPFMGLQRVGHDWATELNKVLKLLALVISFTHVFMGHACIHAKLLQSCLTLQPIRRQPTRLLCPQDSLGKNTGVDCQFLLCLWAPLRNWFSPVNLSNVNLLG